MFKMKTDGDDIFSKVIPRMGVFHVIMCMLKIIFARFIEEAEVEGSVFKLYLKRCSETCAFL